MSPSRRAQQGLTLVELMVAVAINLVVVLVAAYLYLNGRSTQQAVEERAAMFENGQLALELLGKEIGNAGYYPAHMHEPDATLLVNLGRYVNPAPAVAAFNAGVFGCSSGRFWNGPARRPITRTSGRWPGVELLHRRRHEPGGRCSC